jgi:hypothetical protein
MVQLLRDQYDDEPAWRVVARAAADLAITIPSQHLEAHMNRPSTHLVPLLYTAVACGDTESASTGNVAATNPMNGTVSNALIGASGEASYRLRSVITARPRYRPDSSSSKIAPSSERAPVREMWLRTLPATARSTSSRMSCTVPTAE